MRVEGDDVPRRDDAEHLDARPNSSEAQKVQRRVWIELARFPQRRVGHDHRPHLGELNEQDVPRPAGRRGSQADEAQDAGDDGEQKYERDSDPVVDRPHQVRSQSSLVSKEYYAATALVRRSDSSSLTVRSGCRASPQTVAQPISPQIQRQKCEEQNGRDVEHRPEPEDLRSGGAWSARPMDATMLRGPRLSGTRSTISRCRATRILMPTNIANGTSDHRSDPPCRTRVESRRTTAPS